MVHAKNYETKSKLVKVMPRILWLLFFRILLFISTFVRHTLILSKDSMFLSFFASLARSTKNSTFHKYILINLAIIFKPNLDYLVARFSASNHHPVHPNKTAHSLLTLTTTNDYNQRGLKQTFLRPKCPSCHQPTASNYKRQNIP